jgi:hypothetical protein
MHSPFTKLRVISTHINISRGSGEDLVLPTRPSRHVVPTSRLTNADNVEQPQLSFQRKAVEDFRTRQDRDPTVTRLSPPISHATIATLPPCLNPSISTVAALPPTTPPQPTVTTPPPSSAPPSSAVFLQTGDLTLKRNLSAIVDTDNDEDDEDVSIQPKPCKSFKFY